MTSRATKSVVRALACGLAGSILLVAPIRAEIVNIDLEGGSPTTTHTGADGILSESGEISNSVLVDGGIVSGLFDEHGTPTTIGAMLASGPASIRATNYLQDSGADSGFFVTGLDPDVTYDVAIYGNWVASSGPGQVSLSDASGQDVRLFTTSPTFKLPGIEGGDYLRFPGRGPIGDGSTGAGTLQVHVFGSALVAGVQPSRKPDLLPVSTLSGAVLIVLTFVLLAGGIVGLRRDPTERALQ